MKRKYREGIRSLRRGGESGVGKIVCHRWAQGCRSWWRLTTNFARKRRALKKPLTAKNAKDAQRVAKKNLSAVSQSIL